VTWWRLGIGKKVVVPRGGDEKYEELCDGVEIRNMKKTIVWYCGNKKYRHN
jgi:hypothetical protein